MLRKVIDKRSKPHTEGSACTADSLRVRALLFTVFKGLRFLKGGRMEV